MDKGVEFVHNNFKEILKLVEKPEYNHLKNKVLFEWNSFNQFTKTGELYSFFLKYADGTHKDASEFEFLDEFGLLSSEKISDYLMENYPDEIESDKEFGIDNLTFNNVYNNNELFLIFNDFMSGIRSNRDKKIIGCVLSHEGIYEDEWLDEKTLLYYGEGKRGDQKKESPGNKDMIIAAGNKSEWKVFLFEKIKANKYYYRGEIEIDPLIRSKSNILDIDYKPRAVLQFVLKLKESTEDFLYTEDDLIEIENSQKKTIKKMSPEIVHQIAKSKTQDIKVEFVTVKQYNRDQAVSKDTKNRAKGKCDLCNNEAPFKTKDGPYLENHHVITIAEGGPDFIYNTVALCPNCHRKMHSLKDPKDLKKLTEVIKKYLLDDNDLKNLEKWEKLFNK